MKKLILSFIVLIPYIISGQTSNSSKILLNSQFEISFDSVFLFPNNVESITVAQNPSPETVIIKTKSKVWIYKTISDILKTTPEYFKIMQDKSFKLFFYVNEKPINKITDAKIDTSYFPMVVFKKLSDIKSVDNCCRNLVIVEIKLVDVSETWDLSQKEIRKQIQDSIMKKK